MPYTATISIFLRETKHALPRWKESGRWRIGDLGSVECTPMRWPCGPMRHQKLGWLHVTEIPDSLPFERLKRTIEDSDDIDPASFTSAPDFDPLPFTQRLWRADISLLPPELLTSNQAVVTFADVLAATQRKREIRAAKPVRKMTVFDNEVNVR